MICYHLFAIIAFQYLFYLKELSVTGFGVNDCFAYSISGIASTNQTTANGYLSMIAWQHHKLDNCFQLITPFVTNHNIAYIKLCTQKNQNAPIIGMEGVIYCQYIAFQSWDYKMTRSGILSHQLLTNQNATIKHDPELQPIQTAKILIVCIPPNRP